MNRMYGRGIDPMQKFWSRISPEDQIDFIRLRNSFLQNAKFSSKDRRVVAFRNELIIALKYIEKRSDNIEMRSIITGLSFCGPLIAVNNRQLKLFTGRCKSSINGSFQQLGYGAVKTKAKAKACVVDLLPSLATEPQLLRQWTVRIATDSVPFCFVSCPKNVPILSIIESDFVEEAKQSIGSSDPSSAEGSPLQAKDGSPPVELAAHKAQQVHFQLNPPTFTNLFHTPVVQTPVQQQHNQSYPLMGQFPTQFQSQTQNFQPQNSMHVPTQITPLSYTYVQDEFIDESDTEKSSKVPSLSTSYSVNNFDDEYDDFFGDFWSNPSEIKKSHSAMFAPPTWQDDILADMFI